MAQLQTHSLPDLTAVNLSDNTYRGSACVMPGQPVIHKDDPKSYGICLSRRWVWDDKPMQCEVLWSKEPKLLGPVQTQAINTPSRRLNAKWSALPAEPSTIDGTGFGGRVSRSPRALYEVEEEYEYLSYEEGRAFHEQGAEVQFHIDGKVTVKRQTDNPPHDMNDDCRIARRNIRTTY